MHTVRLRTALLLIFVLVAAHASAPAQEADSQLPAFPFMPGEKLHYSVYWSGIKAAEATLEIKPMDFADGAPAWHFMMTAKTTGIAAAIYPLQDRMNSRAAADMTRALNYIEHSRKRFSESTLSITFDWDAHTAHTVKKNKQRTVELKPGAFDPLSIFYFFRMQKLGEGVVLSRPVADRKRCISGVAHVRERQTIHSGGREWDTWLVEPDLRQIEGVYEKHPDARMQIWVSADERRIPVKVTSKVTLGSFTAELEGMEFPEEKPPGTAAVSSPGPLHKDKGSKQP
jgi:hypothetical protein